MGLEHFDMEATFAATHEMPQHSQIPMEAPHFFPDLPADIDPTPTYLHPAVDPDYRSSISGSPSSDDSPYRYGSIAQQTTRSNSVASSLNSEASMQQQLQPMPTIKTEPDTPQPMRQRLASSSSSSSRSSASRVTKSGEEEPPRQKARRHRKKFSPVQKVETHMTRLEGACLRCWRNRKRCIKVDGACCKYCNTLLDPIPNIPCFRSRLSSSELFRKGPTDDFCWTRRRWLQTPFNDTKVWKSPQRRLIVTQGMDLQLELLVKQYDPLPEDQDTYTWTDLRNGQQRAWKMPRYAVADIGGAQEGINRYVGDNMQRYIEKKIGQHDTIPWKTFQMAVKMSVEGSSLLRNALRLWTASRIIEDPWEIIGSERLGMEPSNDPGSPYYNKVPVTPVMDFQIDSITIHKILLPLRKQVLQELQKKVLENRRKDFMEIFLTMYILLHNIELTIAHDRWFAQRWNVKQRFSNYELIDNVFLGANIMLTHFHYVTKGYAAFAHDWKQNAPEKPKEEQIRFMDAISTAARHQASSLKMLREQQQYGSPMFWCSQLFYDGWKPVASPCAA